MNLLLKVGIFVISLFLSSVYLVSAYDPVGDWNTSSNILPYQYANTQVVNVDNAFYILGGAVPRGIARSDTYFSSNPLLEWSKSKSLPENLIWHSVVKNNNNLYLIGGTIDTDTSINSVNTVYKNITLGYGIFDNWKPVQPLPKRLSMFSSAIVGDRIYVSGGFTWTDGGSPAGPWSEVYTAKLSDLDGIKADVWSVAGYLPQARASHTMLNINGRLFVIAGAINPGVDGANTVFIASLGTDGNIDHWDNGKSLPVNLHYPIVNYDNGYLYVAGGYNNDFQKQVYYSKVYPDGNMDEWTTSAHPLPGKNCCTSSVIHNGIWYIFGGHDGGYLDNIFYTRLSPSEPDPITPPVTPPPVKRPIILIPGIGACWNYDALIHGTVKDNKDWTLGIYALPYTGILKTLTNSGFKEKDDSSIYCYDWRKNIIDNIDELDSKINEILSNKLSVTSVDIIGHSMGGLIGAEYTMQHSQKVNKFVAAGVPFKGSTKAYKIWEGADFSDYKVLERIAMSLVMRANLKKYPNEATELREMVPSIKDLLPVYDYLNTDAATIKPWNSLLWHNTYLPNAQLANIATKTNTVTGIDKETAEYYRVSTRSAEDSRLDKWADGKPIATEYGQGDETVLRKSSYLAGATNIILTGIDHGETIGSPAAQEEILKILEIAGTASGDTMPKVRKSLVVTIASPVTFEVKDAAGIKIKQDDNLAFTDTPETGSYSVTVRSLMPGKYTIFIGRFKDNQEIWDEINGEFTNSGDSKTYNFSYDAESASLGADPIKNVQTELNWLMGEIETSNMNKISNKFWTQKLLQLKHATEVQPIPANKILNMIDNFLYNKEDIGWWINDDPVMRNEILYGLRIIRVWLQQ